MEFTVQFVIILGQGLMHATPLLLFLILVIVLLGLSIGRQEGWSRSDALYYSFITATTVGYGDFRPVQSSAKFKAIIIALVGLVMTGIVVALGVKAAELAFKQIHDVLALIQ